VAVELRQRKRRLPASLVAGAAVIATLVALALWVTFFGRYGVNQPSDAILEGPSGAHWLGADNLGRDVLTRLLIAGRTSLLVAGGATLLAALLGVPIGLVAGYRGGATDSALMAFVDTALSVPPVLLALTLVAVFKPGVLTLILGVGLIFTPYFARLVRGPALSVREQDFVAAARISGVGGGLIMLRHVLPNVAAPVIVQLANTAATCILIEASLSYLGLGVQPPQPSWGRMVSEGQRYMQETPLLVVVPCVALVLASVALGLLADGLQKRLNPRSS
jgi:peptide/nickel transport system permease protein